MRVGVTAVVAVFWAATSGPAAWAQAARSAQDPAARVGDETIEMEEVERGVRTQMAQLERRRIEILQQQLDELVAERLIAQEAKRRGVTPEQLLRDEVQARTPDVSDDEITAFMAQNRSRLPRGDEAELRVRVRDHLRRQHAEQQQQAFVDTLRARTPVTVMFPPRIPVRTDRGYSRGPADAPVVIVEFSDFQCPFCKTVVGTVKQAMDRYPGKVRWIFRDFPIAGLHPEAPKAHEAARCAGAQGKFWEYHDLLFERSPRMKPDDLKQYAAELRLDQAAFAQCLDEDRFAAAVAADIEEGANLGITGTPIFYVNGRALVGAQPLSAFQRAIEGELPKAAKQP
jgi:predicted DsbA family dithiol-disulfide isomerase